jgi:hypothetical protein
MQKKSECGLASIVCFLFFCFLILLIFFTVIAGLFPMVQENKKPTGGIEPPTFRLQSECSTTKLSRRASDMSKRAVAIYRNLPIAQLAERETVDGLTTDISRSLVRIRVGRIFSFFVLSCVWV